jgi:SAM-dependent methyltransferase
MPEYNWEKFIQETKNRSPITFLTEAVEKLVEIKGRALDLGCGAGVDAKFLAENNFQVEAVDLNKDSIEQTKKLCKGLPVLVIQKDIADFQIEPQKYSVIIAWNSLPFVKKSGAIKLFGKIQQGIKKGGFFIFGLFGPEDDWAKNHPKMSFWTVEEIKKLLPDMEFIKIIEKRETGAAVTGEVKFWHKIQGFACRNKNIVR